MAKNSKDYGKIVNGNMVFAPRSLPSTVKDENGNNIDVRVYNPSDYVYRLNGYKPVEYDPYPKDGLAYEPYYEEIDGTIYKHWTEVEQTPTESDRLDAIEAAIVDIGEMICEIWGNE